MKRIFFFLFITSLVLLFQNCSNVGDIKLTQSSSSTSASSSNDAPTDSGNGTGYGGKLGGIFYHYIPGYSCENKHSAFAQLKYTPAEKNSVYYQSQDSSCFSIPLNIPNTNIDSGSLQNKVIGYEEKIFEENNSDSVVILAPEKIIEIWCVDQWIDPTIEVLSTYDNQRKQAQTDFYFQKSAKQSELNTARTTSLQVVNLKSQFFDLVIDKALPGLKTGTFQGRLQLVDLQKNKSNQLLQCRLGGYLDARLWPAKAINYDNYAQSEWSPQDGLFYISSGLSGLAAWAENVFYTYSPFSESKKIQVGRVKNSPGVKSFQFFQNRSKVIIKAQLQGDAATQLYSKNLMDSSEPFLLNNKLTIPGQDVVDDISISPDSRYIYYLDGAQEKSTDIEAWLRVVDTQTGDIRQINQDLSTGSDEAVRQYEVSYSLGKVVYATGFTYVDIWISDLFGGSRRKLDLSSVLGFNPANYFGQTNYYLEWGIKQNRRWVFVQDRYLVLSAVSANSTFSSVVFVIDLLTEKVTFSQQFNKSSFLDPIQGLPAIMIDTIAASTTPAVSPAVDVLYLNLQTSQLRSKTDLVSDFIVAENEEQKNLALKFSMMLTDNLCTFTNESNLGQIQLNDFTWLVLNYSSDSIARIYLKLNQANSCQLVNKMVLDPSVISNFEKSKSLRLAGSNLFFDRIKAKISYDKKNILLSMQGHIYLISTENRPVIEIYTALNKSPRFDDIGFIDNTKVYFSGALIKDYINQTFIWSLPK